MHEIIIYTPGKGRSIIEIGKVNRNEGGSLSLLPFPLLVL